MAVVFVQEVAAGGTAVNATTVILVVDVTTTVGNHLILCHAGRANSAVVTGVVDSKGNTWQIDTTATGTGANVAICSTKIATALVAVDTITVTINATTGHSASVAEYSGLAAASWLDKVAGVVSTTGTASDSGATATTAQADELLVGLTGHQSTVTGFTPEVLSPIWNQNTVAASVSTVQTTRPMYRVVAAAAAYSAKATWTTSRVWGAAIATYKAAAVAGFPHSMIVQ